MDTDLLLLGITYDNKRLARVSLEIFFAGIGVLTVKVGSTRVPPPVVLGLLLTPYPHPVLPGSGRLVQEDTGLVVRDGG